MITQVTSTKPSQKLSIIVGIGASAGGLDALTKLLKQLKADNKKVYVIAQHMGKAKENHLTPFLCLLQRVSILPVIEATHDAPLHPDHIYLLPPGVNAEILQGRIQLVAASENHISCPSINILFNSIAQTAAHNGLGIILSGTGSDGRAGAEAIKLRGGQIIAQEPASAQFNGMPSAIINAMLADYILPPQAIAVLLNEGLSACSAQSPIKVVSIQSNSEVEQHEALHQILQKIRDLSGRDFLNYKEETLLRRIARRMSLLHISTFPDYLSFIASRPLELSVLQQEFLISVSSFFRDAESFAVLKQHLSELIANKQPGDSIRIWVPGCATGEECYSLAILVAEILEERLGDFAINIIGSDLNQDALASARTGSYNKAALREAAPEILLRYTEQENDRYKVTSQILAICSFQAEDILQTQPSSPLDLISCRNVLIYLKSSLQDELIKRFYELLPPKGLLFIGQSETIGLSGSALFMPLDHQHRIYSRKQNRHSQQ